MMTHTTDAATKQAMLDDATVAMVQDWLRLRRGNVESTVRFMADTLRIGSRPACREIVHLVQAR